MTNNFLEESIQKLNLDNKTNLKLTNNNILIIKDLWSLTRKKLKNLGLTDREIKCIIIKLQLHSIDLNQKIYTK